MRLNKFLAMAGVSSRRKADDLIREGKVRINGSVVLSLGTRINPEQDQVFVGEKQAVLLDRMVYVLFNKPKDAITTTRDERGRSTVMEFIQMKERVFPIGRLDRNTTGVLLLTNDGEFANRLMHPRYNVRKDYTVTLDTPVSAADLKQLAHGVRLSDGKTAPAHLEFLPGGKNQVVGISIEEGRNRQIHRMFEALGYHVEKLDRVAYAGITYEGLPRGRWRFLSKPEMIRLREIAGMEKA